MSYKSTVNNERTIHAHVDARGLRCPLPLLRAKQALKTLQRGEHVEVLATDPTAKDDFDAMLKHLPDELVYYNQGTTHDTFIICRG